MRVNIYEHLPGMGRKVQGSVSREGTNFQGRKATPLAQEEQKRKAIMTINPIYSGYGAESLRKIGDKNVRNARETNKRTNVSPNDQVEVSSQQAASNTQAKEVATVKQAVQDLPEVRLPLVDEIRELIKQNKYPIDAEKMDIMANSIIGKEIFA